ncbi:hypothetical protein H4696_006526 [Amycolatopsis lexingtonensis]|uniref:Uncharacterized protein n=1 Tax=Amycolatopsis lexingtonensis TaxID=218822 RepID=A0ABR9I899_9PSEU|nr:hypothetical protein [Amycolatopsis lexingtonensis]MBE1499426.1 hypothetical protein [Amycolatopsis lexingtonensis]
MPGVRRISPAEYAVYQGESHPAAERVPAGVQLYREGEPWKLVPIADLEEWYTVRTYGTFLEREFEVVDERDGRYSLFMTTGDGRWAARVWAEPETYPEVDFQRPEMMVFVAVAPKDMVTDLREVRSDHLKTEEY